LDKKTEFYTTFYDLGLTSRPFNYKRSANEREDIDKEIEKYKKNKKWNNPHKISLKKEDEQLQNFFDSLDLKEESKKKTKVQIKKEEIIKKKQNVEKLEKSGNLNYDSLNNFYETLDNIAKSKSKRREKQFTDIYGKDLLVDIFQGQFARDFYSTPIKCLKKVQNDFKLAKGSKHVLEVSSGLGAMIYWYLEFNKKSNKSKITAIEINPKFTKFLKGTFQNKINVVEGDFFEKTEKYIKDYKRTSQYDRSLAPNDFDFILANPPFKLAREGKENKKVYLEFLWRSIKILQQSKHSYEKQILFISPALDNSNEKKNETFDPYEVFEKSSKNVQKRILKENNWTQEDVDNGELTSGIQIMNVGNCSDFGGTNITAQIYLVSVF